MIMIALMPVRESWLTIRGESSLARWRFIGVQWSMVAGILACLWLTMVGTKTLLFSMGIEMPKALVRMKQAHAAAAMEETGAFIASAAWASTLNLLACVLVVQMLAIVFRRERKPRAA